MDERVGNRLAQDLFWNLKLVYSSNANDNGLSFEVFRNCPYRIANHVSNRALAKGPVDEAQRARSALGRSRVHRYVYHKAREELLGGIARRQEAPRALTLL